MSLNVVSTLFAYESDELRSGLRCLQGVMLLLRGSCWQFSPEVHDCWCCPRPPGGVREAKRSSSAGCWTGGVSRHSPPQLAGSSGLMGLVGSRTPNRVLIRKPFVKHFKEAKPCRAVQSSRQPLLRSELKILGLLSP